MFDDEPTVAWRAMGYRSSVVGVDGSEIGTAESLLGDDKEDIFHGIALKRGGKVLEVPAARITRITEKHVVTDLAADEVDELPLYTEERWFHIGWGGLFRKHPEWKD